MNMPEFATVGMRSLTLIRAAVTLAGVTLAAATLAAPGRGEAQTAPTPITLLALGDSLSAGYMLPPAASFPAQLQVALAAKGYKVEVVNAGVSGDTSAGGLQRLDWSLEDRVDGVILELGANDALRGIEPRLTQENLDKLVAAIKGKGKDVLLAGMKAPGNWGPEYQATFDAIFPALAAKHDVALYPFFLEGVIGGADDLTMDDGLHPTEKGVAEVVRRILPKVEAFIQKIAARKASAVASP